MLNDRVTLVTGGGTVIGKAIGVQFAKSGSKVALAFRDPGHLQSAICERQTTAGAVLQSPLLRMFASPDSPRTACFIRAIQGKS